MRLSSHTHTHHTDAAQSGGERVYAAAERQNGGIGHGGAAVFARHSGHQRVPAVRRLLAGHYVLLRAIVITTHNYNYCGPVRMESERIYICILCRMPANMIMCNKIYMILKCTRAMYSV